MQIMVSNLFLHHNKYLPLRASILTTYMVSRRLFVWSWKGGWMTLRMLHDHKYPYMHFLEDAKKKLILSEFCAQQTSYVGMWFISY